MNQLAFIDIESTGKDPAKDKIITLAIRRPEGHALFQFNPGIPIPKEATECHGITDEMARQWSVFTVGAAARITQSLEGCDIAGFNHINFDIPMLWEELYRMDYTWDLSNVALIDVGNIFKKKEERTLSAAVQFYCNRQHEEAHSADGDVKATAEVFDAQLARYPDLIQMNRKQMAEFCRFDDRVDLAGKLVKDKDGNVLYNIGKAKGTKVKDDPGFGYWMLGKEFSQNTKLILKKLLSENDPRLHGGAF